MPGLVDMELDTEKPLDSVKGYDAENFELDDKDTVQGQIERIISKDSPLMRLQRTRSLQDQNRKGTANSSMAIQAGETAVLDKAESIGRVDAQLNYDAKKSNAMLENESRRFNADSYNQGALTLEQGRQALEQIDRQGDIQSRLQQEQGEIDTGLQELRGDQALEQIGAQGDIQKQLEELRGRIESGHIVQRGEIQKMLTQLQGDIESRHIGQRGDIESRLAQERGEIQKELAEAEGEIRERLMERQGEIDRQLQELQGIQRMEQIGYEGSIKETLQAADNNMKFILSKMDNDSQKEIQQLINENRMQLQTSQSAAMYYSSFVESMSDLLANPDIPPEQKQSLIDKHKEQLRSGLTIIGETGNMNLAGLFEFTNAGGQHSDWTGGNTGGTGGTDPIGGSNPVADQIRSIRDQGIAAGQSQAQVLEQAYQYASQNNYSVDMLAAALEMSRDTVIRNLQSIGRTLPGMEGGGGGNVAPPPTGGGLVGSQMDSGGVDPASLQTLEQYIASNVSQLQGTGGSGSQAQQLISSIKGYAQRHGIPMDQVAQIAAGYFPNSTADQIRSLL